MISPCWSCVRALNALQNSMMFTPCWPSAGPTGGEGFAAPAGHCSLTWATTFLAMPASDLLYVLVGQPHRSGAAEDCDHHLDLLLLGAHLRDRAREVGEGPVDHAHVLALLERDLGRRLLGLGLAEHALDVLGRDGRRAGRAGTDEARDLCRVLDDVPDLVVELHADEDVAGQELALAGLALALDHLDDVLLGDEDLLDRVLLAVLARALDERLLRPGFLTRVRVDDVPMRVHRNCLACAGSGGDQVQSRLINPLSAMSTTHNPSPMTPTSTITAIVPATVSFWVGQVTFLSSSETSARNARDTSTQRTGFQVTKATPRLIHAGRPGGT